MKHKENYQSSPVDCNRTVEDSEVEEDEIKSNFKTSITQNNYIYKCYYYYYLSMMQIQHLDNLLFHTSVFNFNYRYFKHA